MRSGLYYAFFALIIAAALIGGLTSAWFATETDRTDNAFIAGTLNLEVTNLNETLTGSWEPGECLENQYTITNTGSKKIYVRASFEGFWKRLYHRNTATVTALYNGQIVSDADQAYYTFGDYSPSFSPDFTPEASIGFFDDSIPASTVFPVLWRASGSADPTGPVLDEIGEPSISITGYPDDCSGPLVKPITGSALSNTYPGLFGPGLNDPDPDKVRQYLGPETCDNFYTIKIDEDQDGVPDGGTYTDSKTGFTVTIYKKLISGKYYFAYQTNFPVYHLYAKGGNQGGNFYLYYPTYPDGVYQDCGLSQPGGDWSHITFYYCVPPANPSIKIIKQVSIDGGASWLDADEAFGPELIGYQPKFRFWVTNTGNVTLDNIVIEDDVFGHFSTIPSLEAGASDGFIIDDQYLEKVLDSGNVQIKLCDISQNDYDKNNWIEVDGYFYYRHALESGQSVTLCVKACLAEPVGALYDGAQFTLYSYFEAVQTTNGLVHDNWVINPY